MSTPTAETTLLQKIANAQYIHPSIVQHEAEIDRLMTTISVLRPTISRRAIERVINRRAASLRYDAIDSMIYDIWTAVTAGSPVFWDGNYHFGATLCPRTFCHHSVRNLESLSRELEEINAEDQ